MHDIQTNMFTIFTAEMAKWAESRPAPDNPNAEALIFYGDGKGNIGKG